MREFTSVDTFQVTGKGTAYVTHDLAALTIVRFVEDTALTCSMYFAACKSPTPRFRREERMIPDLA